MGTVAPQVTFRTHAPPTTAAIMSRTSGPRDQNVTFNPTDKTITWTISQFPGGSYANAFIRVCAQLICSILTIFPHPISLHILPMRLDSTQIMVPHNYSNSHSTSILHGRKHIYIFSLQLVDSGGSVSVEAGELDFEVSRWVCSGLRIEHVKLNPSPSSAFTKWVRYLTTSDSVSLRLT